MCALMLQCIHINPTFNKQTNKGKPVVDLSLVRCSLVVGIVVKSCTVTVSYMFMFQMIKPSSALMIT